MQGRFLLRAILASAMSLPVLAGCGEEAPTPTPEQKKADYGAESAAKIKALSGDLKQQKSTGPMGPGDMMKKQ